MTIRTEQVLEFYNLNKNTKNSKSAQKKKKDFSKFSPKRILNNILLIKKTLDFNTIGTE